MAATEGVVQPSDTDERSCCQNLMEWCGGRTLKGRSSPQILREVWLSESNGVVWWPTLKEWSSPQILMRGLAVRI